MPSHDKWSHPWPVHTSRLLMSKNSINKVHENLFLLFGRGKTETKPHLPSTSAFWAIFVWKESWYLVSPGQIPKLGDHVNSVPDLAASLPWRSRSQVALHSMVHKKFGRWKMYYLNKIISTIANLTFKYRGVFYKIIVTTFERSHIVVFIIEVFSVSSHLLVLLD